MWMSFSVTDGSRWSYSNDILTLQCTEEAVQCTVVIVPDNKSEIKKGIVTLMIIGVLGMHRSGTSLLTSMLAMCGIYPGPDDKLVQPEVKTDNPYGYWEYMPFVHINNELLTLIGGSWRTPPPIFKQWTSVYDLDDIESRVWAHLEADYAHKDLVVWKDPRTCLTIEFWKNVFPDMKPIVIVRNPLEVAFSMAAGTAHTRDLPVTYALSLWNTYHDALFLTIDPQEALFIHYDNLIQQPEHEINRIIQYLDISPELEQIEKAIAKVHLKQRSHSLLLNDLPEDIAAKYLTYCQYAAYEPPQRNDNDIPHDLIIAGDRRFQNLLTRYQKQISQLDAYVEQLAQREADLQKRQIQIDAQREALAQADTQIQAQQNEIEQSQQHIQEQIKALAQADAQIKAQQTELQQARQQIEIQREALAQAEAQIQAQQNEIKQSQHLIERQNKGLDEYNTVLMHRDQQITQYQKHLSQQVDQFSVVQPLVLEGFLHQWLRASKLFKWVNKAINRWRIRKVSRLHDQNKIWIPNLFDANWYIETYPDVKQSGIAPYVHFYLFGWYQGYRPMPIFDVLWYASRYPDFNVNGMNPLEHYESIGQSLGNRPCAFFDPQWYMETNPDVQAAGMDPLKHYCYTGWREQRNPSPEFNTDAYLKQHPKLLKTNQNPLDHYLSQDRSRRSANQSDLLALH